MDSAEADARAKAHPGKGGKKLGAKPKKTFKFNKKLLSSDEEDEAEESDESDAYESDDFAPVKSRSIVGGNYILLLIFSRFTESKPKAAPAPKKQAATTAAKAKPESTTVAKAKSKVTTAQTSVTSFFKPKAEPVVAAAKKPFSSLAIENDDDDLDRPVLTLAQMIEMKKAAKRKELEAGGGGVSSTAFESATLSSANAVSEATAPAAKKIKLPTKKPAVVFSSDDDEEEVKPIVQKKKPAAKPSATVKKPVIARKKKTSSDDDDDDDSRGGSDISESDVELVPRSQPTRNSRQPATKKAVQYVDVDSDDVDDDDINDDVDESSSASEEDDDDDYDESD